ncbi:MAG: hypothetical protein RR651_12730 [Lysinibacillus sp.]
MTVEIGVVVAVLSLVIAYMGYVLNKQKDIKSESQQDAQVSTQLQYISKGVDEIRIDLKANERQMVQYGERITRVEESTKQAHHRINGITKGDYKDEN